MDYGAIIKRSVELTWRNRLLWVFGILVAIFAGGAGGNAGQGLQYTFNQQDMERWRRTMPYGMLPWRQLAAVGVGLIIVLVLLVLVWIVVRVIVGYTSEGALVAAADDLDRGRKPTFREAFSRGWQRFLRLFAQDVIIGLIAFVVALIVLLAYAIVAGLILAPGIVAVAANGAISRTLGIIWLVLLGIVVFVGFVLVVAAIAAAQTVVRAYALRASVLKLEGVFDALGSAWALLRARLRQSLAMWLWMALISLGIALVFLPIALLVGVLLAAPAAGLFALSRSPVLPALLLVPLLGLLALVMVWFSGLLAAFKSTVWTLTYNELTLERD